MLVQQDLFFGHAQKLPIAKLLKLIQLFFVLLLFQLLLEPKILFLHAAENLRQPYGGKNRVLRIFQLKHFLFFSICRP